MSHTKLNSIRLHQGREMPIEIEFERRPGGYAVSAARANEQVAVQVREFTSTEDGQHFIRRLEGLPTDILRKLPSPTRPSQVDNMLAVYRRDGKATVYINELQQKAHIRPGGPIRAGQIVTKNDIVDVERLQLDAEMPDEAGILFLFSVGWRKGLFYDFDPIGGPNAKPRQYDLAAVLGQAYCYVLFQERFSITDAEWDALSASKWFLFAGLRGRTIDALITQVRSGWDPDEKLDAIASEIKGRVPQMLESWRNHSSFAPHVEVLERAVERFQDNDFVSCTGLLYPRIEGILRTHHTSLDRINRPTPDNLTRSAVSAKIDNEQCLLLPRRFAAYLHDVYFADFSPVAQDVQVSRHSIAHGVASTAEFNQKSALLGILVIHQLFYFLDNRHDKHTETNEGWPQQKGA